MEGREPLAKSGEEPSPLSRHLREVAEYVRQAARAHRVWWEKLLGSREAERVGRALVVAALAHDLGKIAQGFQRALSSRRYVWEFRHEVLSAALLLAGEFADDEGIRDLVVASVLTHHRDLGDGQLQRDAGLVIPPLLKQAREKLAQKIEEMRPHWPWLREFVSQCPELSSLGIPESPEALRDALIPEGPHNEPLPAEFLDEIEQRVDALSLDEKEALSLILTRGWLMAADHATSAGVREYKVALPHPSLPPLRRFQREVGSHTGHAFLEAPTGSGKTIAALLWALRNREGGERIFYLLPYQASIEAMADTLSGFFGAENVAVLHARALDYAFREHFEGTGEYEAAVRGARERVELDRLAHKPIKVATPFQLLKWFFGIPRWEIGVSEMVGGLFIFDEIHAYDAHVVALIAEMVRVLGKLGGRFLFMSATFPPFLKELLEGAVGEPVAEFELRPEDGWSKRFLSCARHRLRWRESTLEGLLPEIVRAAREGRKVLVVANRVAQAQEIFRTLREEVPGVHLLHSRFTRRDRVTKERTIIEALKDGGEVDLRVLVATQVVEVSLDVSFSTIFTEIAPVDDLLQRFGRVNRYGEHAGGVDVHVATEFDEDRLRYVYDIGRLLSTRESGPQDGTPLTAPCAAEWVREVYREGWTEKERGRFKEAREAFSRLLSDLRPLRHLEEGREEFLGLFQSVEVLPKGLFSEYEEHRRERRFLLANQLLVPIPLGTFHKLNNTGCLTRREDGTLLADVSYDDELGLLPGRNQTMWD